MEIQFTSALQTPCDMENPCKCKFTTGLHLRLWRQKPTYNSPSSLMVVSQPITGFNDLAMAWSVSLAQGPHHWVQHVGVNPRISDSATVCASSHLISVCCGDLFRHEANFCWLMFEILSSVQRATLPTFPPSRYNLTPRSSPKDDFSQEFHCHRKSAFTYPGIVFCSR